MRGQAFRASDEPQGEPSQSDRVPVLEARGLYAGYGHLAVVRDLNLAVYAGEIVALLGPNGAGKTTTLLTLGGALPAVRGEVLVDGTASAAPLYQRVRNGMGFIPEERSIISKLTVRENLRSGAERSTTRSAFSPSCGHCCTAGPACFLVASSR